MSSLGNVKGNAFRELLRFLEQREGPALVQRVHAALPDEFGSALDPARPALGVLASTWYPAELVHAVLDAVLEGRTEADVESLAREASRATLAAMMRGVQRAAFRLLVSPARYPRIINVLWGLNYDSGSVRVVVHGPREHEGIVTGWRAHHAFACRLNHEAKVPLYETMGCRDVVVTQTACVSHGDADCRSTVIWADVSGSAGRMKA